MMIYITLFLLVVAFPVFYVFDNEYILYKVDPSKETKMKKICKRWHIDEEAAFVNWKKYLEFVECVSKEAQLMHLPLVYAYNFVEKNSLNACARKGDVFLEPGIARAIMSRNEYYEYAILVTGHELAHIKNKDKKTMTKIDNIKIEVRADIDGRIIVGMEKEKAAELMEEIYKESRKYNKGEWGYPSRADRVKYLRKYDSYNEALEKEIEKDYL